MASLLAAWKQRDDPESGPSDPAPRKKIPKVAVYVSGATFAITLGLTALILPYARQAAKLARPPPEFRNNTHLLLKRPRPRTIEGVDGTGRIPSPLTSASASLAGPESMTPASEAKPEEHDFEEERGEPVSGFLAFKALGIATAVVFGSAGLGALAVAKLLGVNDMEGFASKMREGLDTTMPGLTGGMKKHGIEHDELADLLDDMAREPEELEELELQRTLRAGAAEKPSSHGAFTYA